ncbi:MerR family transcriptional regulator [Leucobacter sp. UCD-THU]|uniref:MerR family transcriptional regulator n=1 Tax=Leucobacter muris TaxID=1935379 RepID=A0ABX5QC46_9MICO|nr:MULTISPECIES: TipAS antibiotic-recognition domain-containing protein [Leucobacter]EYT54781.1 MerR family transcriptional regulator [Leucobacter sp. UCD-THU]QAB16626.1 MerR family transcriptional regulator [Leucobacter muris]
MEHSIQQIARAAGTTSRTLRHYDRIGLVRPSRVGVNGYRYYDDRALVRLQRVLLLRELGLGLEAIGEVLRAQDAQARGGEPPAVAEARILGAHLELLRRERARVDAQIGSVERTIAALDRAGRAAPGEDHAEENLMSENMFDGFDHTRYREEVERRWGADAYARSDRWWRGLGEQGRAEWRARMERLGRDWIAAAGSGADPESAEGQDLARRHVEWLRGVPGTPASEAGGDLAGYVLGLAEMYAADDRFAANYGGAEGARFVRDALRVYVERELRG